MFLLFVVAMLCSTTMTSAQNSEAPQRYGWGYPYVLAEPLYSLYFRHLYGDVESVTIMSSGNEELLWCNPFPSTFMTYIFNTRGDVVACVGQDAEGREESRKTWVYNDNGHVVSFCETEKSDNYKRKVFYIYDSSERLVGASVTGSSDYFGEFSHNVIVNKYNRNIIDLFGIDFFTGRSCPAISYHCPYGKIGPEIKILDRDLSDVNQYIMNNCIDGDGMLDTNRLCDDFIEDISFGSYSKIFAGLYVTSREDCLFGFNSNSKMVFDCCLSPGDGPKVQIIYNYDKNGRLVRAKSYNCDGFNEYIVCEYDDDGKLIGYISYDTIYLEDGVETKKYKPVRVVNCVYDSHGNIIRLLNTNLQFPEVSSSTEFLIRYRK